MKVKGLQFGLIAVGASFIPMKEFMRSFTKLTEKHWSWPIEKLQLVN